MDEEAIKKALKEAGISDSIACEEAYKISERTGIPKADIGTYCTKHRIKIRHCQLGCFK
ncbi:MAG: hypothetical protein LUQ40_00745 [Methanomicrobiales archaeon]|nr:hypothetical protein [Methanomicrobiales archaeon]